MASPRPEPAPPRARPPEPAPLTAPLPAPPGEPVAITLKPEREPAPPSVPSPAPALVALVATPAPTSAPAAPVPTPDTCYVRNSSFLSRDIEAQKARADAPTARRPAEVPPRKSSITAATVPNSDPTPPVKERPPSPPRRASSPIKSPPLKSPPIKSPPIKSPPVKSPPVKSPPMRASPAGDRTPPVSVIASPPSRRATPPRNDVTSPPAADVKAPSSGTRNEESSGIPRTPWRQSPVAERGPRVEKLSLATSVIDKPIDNTETSSETVVENAQGAQSDNGLKSEESNGVGDKIKKFEKAAEDASANTGRLSRPGSVRGRPRTERLGSDNSREDLPPPATPFKDNVHFDLGATPPSERPPTVLERQQSLTRNAAAASAPVRWQRSDSAAADGEKIRPEPQKIIKPEFKPMPSPVDVTIRSPSLGVKIADQFPSHGTAFRNVASPDPARSRDIHKFNDDVNTQNNFKTCKFKNKEKYSVSKGSSYFTRGSEEIWLVKKKDIEEIEERVLDSFRRAGGNICVRSESMRPSSDSGQSATMGRSKRPAYARSESLDPQWAGARAHTLKRQTSVACTCHVGHVGHVGHDKKSRAKSADSAPRARSRSHGDDNNQAHVLDKYETLV